MKGVAFLLVRTACRDWEMSWAEPEDGLSSKCKDAVIFNTESGGNLENG